MVRPLRAVVVAPHLKLRWLALELEGDARPGKIFAPGAPPSLDAPEEVAPVRRQALLVGHVDDRVFHVEVALLAAHDVEEVVGELLELGRGRVLVRHRSLWRVVDGGKYRNELGLPARRT